MIFVRYDPTYDNPLRVRMSYKLRIQDFQFYSLLPFERARQTRTPYRLYAAIAIMILLLEDGRPS